MVKEPSYLDRTIFQAESLIHQDYIHIVRIRLGGNIAAENNEMLDVPCELSQRIDMKQASGAEASLPLSTTESLHHFVQCSLMHARRQITNLIKLCNAID